MYLSFTRLESVTCIGDISYCFVRLRGQPMQVRVASRNVHTTRDEELQAAIERCGMGTCYTIVSLKYSREYSLTSLSLANHPPFAGVVYKYMRRRHCSEHSLAPAKRNSQISTTILPTEACRQLYRTLS
jgi:hypothetical protein